MNQSALVVTRSLVVLLTCSLPLLAQGDAGGWWGDLYEEKVVALERVVSSPEGFRDATVSFVIQYHRPGRIDNPFHTRFERSWYMNFSAWPDGASLWQRKIFAGSHPYFFIRRSREETKELAASGTYSRWLARGHVAEIIDGKPWIEIKAMRRLPRAMDEASLVQMVKAVRLRDLGKHAAAARAFQKADHEKLPAWTRTFALRQESAALERTGRLGDALARARLAASLIKDDKQLEALVKRLTARVAKEGPGPSAERPAGG